VEVKLSNLTTRRQFMKHDTGKKGKVAVGDFSLLRMFSVYGGKLPNAVNEPEEGDGSAKKFMKATKRENYIRTF
jgi:hypothetical protein